ncbi:MAG TPA: sugar phosphate isomerase/epimerase [Clostridiaceae bacterium]|nr:sugar phosphate isomerase/epimerase [Clostridiaceae bacterium]
MFYTGLVSITFRNLSPKEIVSLVEKAGLDGIEWGGDIHVPHGDIRKAEEVYRMTSDAGLKVAAYGSYYKVGCEKEQGIPFEMVIDTALALKAPIIRVWAGDRGSSDADEAWWDNVVAEAIRISDLAKRHGLTVSFEYHANTLTDTSESAVKLMKEVGRGNVKSYWQPPVGLDFDSCINGLKQILPWLSNIHIFCWDMLERLPLAQGVDTWRKYMEVVKSIEGDRFCMLEFVKDDRPEQFLKDAETLKQIVK